MAEEQQQRIAAALAARTWAVVGASTNPEKWGHRVYVTLRQQGYQVYPVNARAQAVAGDRCYPSLAALPARPDVVSVIVPPALGAAVVDEAVAAGIPMLWFQPGAESAAVTAQAQAQGLAVVDHACVLEELGRRGLVEH